MRQTQAVPGRTPARSRGAGGRGARRTARAAQGGLLGCGSVGSQVYRLLTEQSADLKARAGAPLQIVGVAVREPDRPRDVPVDPDLLTTDGLDLVTRPDVDIVIELIGGIEPARTLLLAALNGGQVGRDGQQGARRRRPGGAAQDRQPGRR